MALKDKGGTPHKPREFASADSSGSMGCYIHWPFCARICPYCDFTRKARKDPPAEKWIAACLRDLSQDLEWLGRKPSISSIFFGGGTPSMVRPHLIEELLEKLAEMVTIESGAEITMEVNPKSASAEYFARLADTRVNRISIGVQSMNEKNLNFLGRDHNVSDAKDTISQAMKHFEQVSFDMIYGLPKQKASAWQEDLQDALSMGVDHLSCYQLTIEPQTIFGRQVAKGEWQPAANDSLATLFQITQNMCKDKGLGQYEISNFSRAGCQSRHNLLYWRSHQWLGLGVSAHARLEKSQQRWQQSRPKNIDGWFKAHECQRQTLSERELLQEKLLMGLRLSEGIALQEKELLALNQSTLAALIKEDMVKHSNAKLQIVPHKRVLCDAIIRELLS